MDYNRRQFLKRSLQGAAFLTAASPVSQYLTAAPHIKNSKIANKVIVLGIDGMDPVLLRKFVQKGEMPTFKKLFEKGYFGPLQTTMPPQSPVAWSSFISGTNPGGHGIYDFIHRDVSTFTPYLSTSRSFGSDKSLNMGKWSIPLKGGKVELLRRGPAFWNVLENNNIPASLFKLPANFPVVDHKANMISGMGTPDLLGSYGTFTFFSQTDVPDAEKFSGGRVVKLSSENHTFKSKLEGPINSFRNDNSNTTVDFTIFRDPWDKTVKISIQDHEILLRQGEWSEWVPLKFELLPMFAGVSGMVRIYVKQVHPYLQVYMSPINIDPMDPTLPISGNSSYSKELSQAIGRFYTQGFPEDTKALSHGIFSNEEFLKQSKLVLEERRNAFEYEFNQFNEGFFFFYFSSIDQNTHMMWRDMDPSHPLYEPDASKEAKDAVYYFYKQMDDIAKQTLAKMDSSSTLMIMSDHGFAPFGREFHLSTWLAENDFMAATDKNKLYDSSYYDYVDWSKTKAYAMGLNGIYLNLYGRDTYGSVMPREATKIKKEIIEKLEDVRDPKTGKRMVIKAYDSHEIYSGPFLDIAPDIIVGYASGYRISDEAVLGKFPKEVVGDRIDKWSADHCMDWTIVPGTLITNKEVGAPKPAIWDLAPSIINSFGLDVPAEMDGKPVFKA